jgi:hypothetical protein
MVAARPEYAEREQPFRMGRGNCSGAGRPAGVAKFKALRLIQLGRFRARRLLRAGCRPTRGARPARCFDRKK